jgi:hypothetical protein
MGKGWRDGFIRVRLLGVFFRQRSIALLGGFFSTLVSVKDDGSSSGKTVTGTSAARSTL